ncbi:16S rRNA (guanine(527)-N(7))-methyltransferase RsmG [Legionella impletisoli]|uniref:Ribosomal RNA small subunit methyltransferase G n=1 Tax=Legionella impletisoli TaxID=343510 RepID=A0A917JUI7_9GAMM|nr:16S rRNA (guanine(527)-N(7))-methyltransferase RsmG [Legionella impletisoli]GGI86723.1 ribosomal RNA small subunit methyltransferase G [Legionella impletisoli]
MSLPRSIQDELAHGLKQLGLTLPIEPFLAYLQLLHKWNQAYNLTAVRDMSEMVSRHILDSLAILPWVKGKRLIDVGTGPGLPGIPLALARPDLEVVLLDSNGKKIRFLQEVKRMLSLTQIEVVHSRVENYHPTQGFDTVTSRAFSDLSQMLTWTSHLIALDGIWLAMKGRVPEIELQTLLHPYQVEPYTVPGLEGQRCCVIINPK